MESEVIAPNTPLPPMILVLSANLIGLPVKKEEAYKKLGLTIPEDDDDVIEPKERPALLGG